MAFVIFVFVLVTVGWTLEDAAWAEFGRLASAYAGALRRAANAQRG